MSSVGVAVGSSVCIVAVDVGTFVEVGVGVYDGDDVGRREGNDVGEEERIGPGCDRVSVVTNGIRGKLDVFVDVGVNGAVVV